MILRSILIGTLFIFSNIFSQNLIPNGSFEIYNKCPTGPSQNKNDDNIHTIEYAYPWKQPSRGTSDLISSCAENSYLSIPQIGYQSGRACAAILLAGTYYPSQTTLTGCVVRNYREFLQVRLTQPMIQDIKYKFSMWVLPSTDCKTRADAIGAYFTSNQISNNVDTLGYNSTIGGIPQIRNPSGYFLTDTSQWSLIQGVYTALGGESYVTIGNFSTDMQTVITGINGENQQIFGCRVPAIITILPYYFIDNISLLPCGSPVISDAGLDTSYICFGEDFTLLSPRIVEGQNKYQWNNGSTSSDLIVSVPGIYKVKIILNDNECFNNDTIIKTYNVIESPYNSDTTFCLEDYTNDRVPEFYKHIQTFKDPELTQYASDSDPGVYYFKPLGSQKCKNIKGRKLTLRPYYDNNALTVQPVSFCISDTINAWVSTVNSNIQWKINSVYDKKLDGKYNLVFYNTKNIRINVSFTDIYGCKISTPDVFIQQESVPKFSITPKDTGICSGQEVSLTIKSSSSGFEWYNGSKQNKIKVSGSGYYKASSWFSPDCIRSDSALVRVFPNPKFKLSSDTTFCFGHLIPIILKAPAGFKKYVWNTETITGNSFSFSKSCTLNFKIVDTNNCVTESQINLRNNCEDPWFPNVFTPNGDNANEAFEIKNLLPQTELYLFNKWGTKVYTSSNYMNNWNAEGIEDGIYYYQINNPYYKNLYKGWVQVLR